VEKVRVLIVDDSAVMRKIIANAIEKQPSLLVAGYAANGLEAIKAIRSLKPDVLTLDIEMPEMDGLTALREIRKEHKYLPIIMFSSLTHQGAQAAVMALTAGASDYVGKPTNKTGVIKDAYEVLQLELIPKLIGLGKRFQARKLKEAQASEVLKTQSPPPPKLPIAAKPMTSVYPGISNAKGVSKPIADMPVKPAEAVCIGVSTGGPDALMQVFGGFNVPLSVPVFIVQHMPPDFTTLLAARLTANGVMTVKEPVDGEIAEPGMAYIAPGGFHMSLSRPGTKTIIHLNTEPPENSCRPAVDVLFRTAAQVYGSGLLAVMLTGMGYDGLKGSHLIKEKKGQIVAQDEASSVIWGMPGAVVQAGLADQVLPIDKIADEIIFRTRKVNSSR
jgi:two-component system chemotaxis response regulator CheB